MDIFTVTYGFVIRLFYPTREGAVCIYPVEGFPSRSHFRFSPSSEGNKHGSSESSLELVLPLQPKLWVVFHFHVYHLTGYILFFPLRWTAFRRGGFPLNLCFTRRLLRQSAGIQNNNPTPYWDRKRA